MDRIRNARDRETPPDFGLLVDTETSLAAWVAEMNASPTLRAALGDAEECAKLIPGAAAGRAGAMSVFRDVVRSPAVAEAIHGASLSFREVVGLRAGQSKVYGAICASLQQRGQS